MSFFKFKSTLQKLFGADDKKVLECARIAYGMAKDAHEGLSISNDDLRYIGYDHFVDLVRNGEFDIETMQFVD